MQENAGAKAAWNANSCPKAFGAMHSTAMLNKTIVVVPNRNWQAINIRTPAVAFCQMATNIATAFDIEGDGHIRPVNWDEWTRLHVREHDTLARTARGAICVPTVIVAVNYARVPRKRPNLIAKNIREHDGNRCQYTGKLRYRAEGNLDRVVPRRAAVWTRGNTSSGPRRT